MGWGRHLKGVLIEDEADAEGLDGEEDAEEEDEAPHQPWSHEHHAADRHERRGELVIGVDHSLRVGGGEADGRCGGTAGRDDRRAWRSRERHRRRTVHAHDAHDARRLQRPRARERGYECAEGAHS